MVVDVVVPGLVVEATPVWRGSPPSLGCLADLRPAPEGDAAMVSGVLSDATLVAGAAVVVGVVVVGAFVVDGEVVAGAFVVNGEVVAGAAVTGVVKGAVCSVAVVGEPVASALEGPSGGTG